MRFRRVIGILLAGICLGYLLQTVGCSLKHWSVTAARLSPDETKSVVVEDVVLLFFQLDRNFRVLLQDAGQADGASKVVFESPDEGRPVGTERIVWSRDSSKFLLIGRHFLVHEECKLSSGEIVYFMMDLRTGKTWCNARQGADISRLERDHVMSIDWEFPLEWPEPGTKPETK